VVLAADAHAQEVGVSAKCSKRRKYLERARLVGPSRSLQSSPNARGSIGSTMTSAGRISSTRSASTS
jgi:hypothetical protein